MIIGIIGGVFLVTLVGFIVWSSFLMTADVHVRFGSLESSWGVRSVIPAGEYLLIIESGQTSGRRGRQVVRLSTVARRSGSLLAQRHHYGDIEGLGVTGSLAWIDRKSGGGAQAYQLPDLTDLPEAGERLLRDTELSDPHAVYVDKVGRLIVKAEDGRVYAIDTNSGSTRQLPPKEDPKPQVHDAKPTGLDSLPAAGALAFSQDGKRKHITFEGQRVGPTEGYLDGLLLGDHLSGRSLRLPDRGYAVVHQSELGDRSKFRLTALGEAGQTRWSTDAVTLVPRVRYESYAHELQWSAIIAETLFLYTRARDLGTERDTRSHIVALDPDLGSTRWVRSLDG